jgi:hypothetical protein
MPVERMMGKPSDRGSDGSRRGGRNSPEWGPVIWIAILLASWLLIVQWKTLPELMNATMGALP